MLVVLCAMLGMGSMAHAGRKRVVVLDFEGPKGERFHDDLVKLIKKTHTVVPTGKWNGTAEELDASVLSEKNVKKVAKRLKIDAIVEGKIEKRRDEFILRLKLREGRSGEIIGNPIDTKADGPRIDGRAQRDLKDELVDAIGNVESNHLGGSDDEDDKPAVKKAGKKADDDEGEDKPAKKGFSKRTDDERGNDKINDKKAGKKADDDEDEDKPAKKGFSKRTDDERGNDKINDKNDKIEKKAGKKADDDEDKLPSRKPAAAKKADDDDDKLPPRKPAAARKADDNEDKLPPRKPAAARKSNDDDEDKLPPRKLATTRKPEDDGDGGKPAKNNKVASSNDDGNNAEAEVDTGAALDAEAALSPGERALDVVLGLSLTMRRMSFVFRPDLAMRPPGYRGTPVGGAMIDATVYPLAVGHKRADLLKNIGLDLMYDRVFKVNSKDA
ncbi:MAG TPA: hypothetical protein VHN14_15665, partial [Kofleriaceae bacterium]|nr:hypothetical protein [Kofleriaceae bacterium]